jgi:hypothetical protein
MITKLKLTSIQGYLLESYIFDLCNVCIDRDYTTTELQEFDESDQLRIAIYKKYSKLTLTDLTEEELNYVSGEINHFMFGGFERERRDRISGSALIKKIDKLFDKEYQRNKAIDSILG